MYLSCLLPKSNQTLKSCKCFFTICHMYCLVLAGKHWWACVYSARNIMGRQPGNAAVRSWSATWNKKMTMHDPALLAVIPAWQLKSIRQKQILCLRLTASGRFFSSDAGRFSQRFFLYMHNFLHGKKYPAKQDPPPAAGCLRSIFSSTAVQPLRWLASTGTECRRSCDHARRAFSFTGAIFFKRIKT